MEGSERVEERANGQRSIVNGQPGRPTPYSVIDEWMAERDQATTPADGDDYTYDLRTPTERAAFRIEQAEYRLARLEQELRTEIRTLAERLQQVEHVLEQWTGDHG